MKLGRGVPLLLFVVCVVAAMPSAWGEESALDSANDSFAVLSEEVTLCHVPPGNLAGGRTIVVRESWGAFSVRAHLAHGDYLGACHRVYQVEKGRFLTHDPVGSRSSGFESPRILSSAYVCP
jgi:hypothetical protein